MQSIWNDETLYGHFLTVVPNQLWSFATSEDLLFYTKPDPGTAQRVYLIFEKFSVTKRWSNGMPKSFYAATNILPAKYIELGVRRIGGGFLAICTSVLVLPLSLPLKRFIVLCGLVISLMH